MHYCAYKLSIYKEMVASYSRPKSKQNFYKSKNVIALFFSGPIVTSNNS